MMDSAFENLLSNHYIYLRQLASGYAKEEKDAEDLYQETLVKLVTHEKSYNHGTNFKAWAHIIMRNLYINGYRKRKNKWKLLSSIKYNQTEALAKAIQNDAIQHLNLVFIEKTISSLKEEERIPFQMHITGFKYSEIAENLDIPLGTVKFRIHTARKTLQSKLKGTMS